MRRVSTTASPLSIILLFTLALFSSRLRVVEGRRVRGGGAAGAHGFSILGSRRKCSSDHDCIEGDEYCSGGECQLSGSCNTFLDCMNPSNVYGTNRCFGYLDCETERRGGGRCAMNCHTSSCPPDRPRVNCEHKSDPCGTASCNEPYVTCVNDFCGGCHAVFFDAAGNRVCNEPQQCSSAFDCPAGQYCAGGECLENGRCNLDADCHNPQNFFINAHPHRGGCGLKCDEGSCQTECNGCRDCRGVEPCASQTCTHSSALCVNDDCNCQALFFFDEARYQVCHDDQMVYIPGLPSPTQQQPSSSSRGQAGSSGGFPDYISGLPPPPPVFYDTTQRGSNSRSGSDAGADTSDIISSWNPP